MDNSNPPTVQILIEEKVRKGSPRFGKKSFSLNSFIYSLVSRYETYHSNLCDAKPIERNPENFIIKTNADLLPLILDHTQAYCDAQLGPEEFQTTLHPIPVLYGTLKSTITREDTAFIDNLIDLARGDMDHITFNKLLQKAVHALIVTDIYHTSIYFAEVIPKLRLIVTSYDEFSHEFLWSTVNALTSLHLFASVGSNEFELDLEKNLSAFAKLLENRSELLGGTIVAGVGLLVFQSNNRNNVIEHILPRLFKVYKTSSIRTQIVIGKAISLMYYLYDFSDQHNTLDKPSDFCFSIPGVDNQDLEKFISLTVDGLVHERTSSNYQLIGKIRKFIKFCGSPEAAHLKSYHHYEVRAHGLTKDLNIGCHYESTRVLWLQDILQGAVDWFADPA